MVITVDKHKKPVGFTTEKRARQLMEERRACVYRYFPFTIILMDVDVRDLADVPTFRLKIDPGAKHTGMAVVCNETDAVMLYLQIEHRSGQIVDALNTRRHARRNRRSRETRYREPKWQKGMGGKRPSKDGKLPPSVKSIGDNILSITKRLKRLIRLTDCSFEAVRFDTQLMDDPDISGIGYQQGTLFGYELREYLLEHYRHTCQYCGGASGDPVLEWEHKVPKSRGGSDSVKNATLACSCCNREKGNRTLPEWLEHLKAAKVRPVSAKALTETRIRHLEAILKNTSTVYGSDRYAAWSNTTRRYEERGLFALFGDVECASGGRTKYNRTQILHLPKDHHYDALAVGTVPETGYTDRTGGYVLNIKAAGRGSRLRGSLNNCGIIVTKWTDRKRRFNGIFQTGDIVTADIPAGKSKYAGHYVGKLNTRNRSSWKITPFGQKGFDVNRKYIRLRQHADGYTYGYEKAS